MGSWTEREGIHILKCGDLFSVELSRGPMPGNTSAKFWRALWLPRDYQNHHCVHGDLEMVKAKVDWCIVNDMRASIEDYKRLLARTKAPDFKYKGGW